MNVALSWRTGRVTQARVEGNQCEISALTPGGVARWNVTLEPSGSPDSLISKFKRPSGVPLAVAFVIRDGFTSSSMLWNTKRGLRRRPAPLAEAVAACNVGVHTIVRHEVWTC